MDYLKRESIKLTFPDIPKKLAASISLSSEKLASAAGFLAKQIEACRLRQRKLVLFGDFDVDGTASAAIVHLFAKLCGAADVSPYVSRRSDGYGLTRKTVDRLMDEANEPERTTIVLMDLGVNTIDEAEKLLKMGYQLMVIDHHVPSPGAGARWLSLQKTYPEAVLCYDPLLFDSTADRSFSVLSAAGLVYQICMHILEHDVCGLRETMFSFSENGKYVVRQGAAKQSLEAILNTMAKICAIAQAADCMPFSVDTTEGKGLSLAWLLSKDFEAKGPLLGGIAALYELTNTASRIGWVIGPILNAAGRLEDAYAAFELMVEPDLSEARRRLAEMQKVRQRVRGQTQKASDSFEKTLRSRPDRGVVVLAEDSSEISSGVVGIGAARAADHFRRPALYLSYSPSEPSVMKGSMRRGETDFSCEAWILELKNKGIIFAGGGHPAAAGLALRPDKLAELIASAEQQSFNLTRPPVYPMSLDEVLDYQKKIASSLPFGNGHESARLLLGAVVNEISPLSWTNRDTGNVETWAYRIGVSDLYSAKRAELKVMRSNLSDEQADQFDRMEGLSLNLYVQAELTVHDGYKHDSRYARTDLRISARPDTQEPVGALQFISKESLESALKKEKIIHEQLVACPDEQAADVDQRVVLQLDWDERCQRRNFILNKPPPWQLEKKLSAEQMEDLAKFHGGKWDRKAKAHLVSWGIISQLIDGANDSEHWRFEFSEAAMRQYKLLKKEDIDVSENKQLIEPFEIPYLKEGVRPHGFQYADIRIYLSRLFALSNNDMGTGKTIEGACWGALRFSGAQVDESMKVGLPEDHKPKPVLYLTLKGIMGQYADELKRFVDLPVKKITTSDVTAFFKRHARHQSSQSQGSFKKTESVPAELVSKARDELLGEGGEGFVITTYDCVARNPWLISAFEWSGVCLDECHELKTPSTHKTKAVFGQKVDGSPLRGAPVLAMSGTFTKNRPSDWFVWVRLTGADGGCYTKGALSRAQVCFDMRFDALTFERARGFKGREYTRSKRGDNPENGEELKKLMAPFLVRRLKTEISDIPPLSINVRRVGSSGIYLDVIRSLISGDEINETTRSVLTGYGVLQGEHLCDEDSDLKNAIDLASGYRRGDDAGLARKLAMISSLDKAYQVEAVLSELGWLDGDEPFVVMGMHRAAVAEVCSRLEARGQSVIVMTQKDSAKKRREKQEAFQRGEARVFITSYGVGGTGLNLTRSNRMLAINLPYGEATLRQGRDRVHRLGQTRPVEFVVVLLAASIDEAIWRLIENKGRANFATLSVDQLRGRKNGLPDWALLPSAEQAKKDDGRGERGDTKKPDLKSHGFRRQGPV